MFDALIVVCFLSTAKCEILVDMHGPYHLEKWCTGRLTKMKQDVEAIYDKFNIEVALHPMCRPRGEAT